MKIKYYITTTFLTSLMIVLTSCIDDKGNYDYEDVSAIIPVVINGVEDIDVEDRIVLTPQLENMDDESKYEYTWYYIDKANQGIDPEPIKVLAKTINVDMYINSSEGNIQIPQGSYYLILEVRRKDKDVFVMKEVTLNISASPIVRGWYILKSIDNKTDFDYINKSDVMYHDVLNNRVFPFNTQRLAGKPVRMNFQVGYSTQITKPDGTASIVRGYRVFHIVSTEDIKVLNATNLNVLVPNFAGNFYDASKTTRHPQEHIVTNMGSNLLLINAGKLHSIASASTNIGKYGYPKFKEEAEDYFLESSYICNAINIMVFDKLSRSFLHNSPLINEINSFDALPANPVAGKVYVSPSNMNAELVTMSSAKPLYNVSSDESGGMPGHAIMKNPNKEEYYLAWVNFKLNQYPFNAFDTIPANAEMPKASVISSSMLGNFVYYAKANEIKAYQNQSTAIGEDLREITLKSLPTDEKIVFIQEISNRVGADFERTLAVLTNKSTGWKLYTFKITSSSNPEINTTPLKIYEGQGQAHSVFLRP